MLKFINGLSIALLAATCAVADDNIFLNTDVFELEVAANPQISPDGSQIAYARRSMDIMTDRPVSNVWIIDANGRNHRPLLTGEQSFGGQTWSPNGDRRNKTDASLSHWRDSASGLPANRFHRDSRREKSKRSGILVLNVPDLRLLSRNQATCLQLMQKVFFRDLVRGC